MFGGRITRREKSKIVYHQGHQPVIDLAPQLQADECLAVYSYLYDSVY